MDWRWRRSTLARPERRHAPRHDETRADAERPRRPATTTRQQQLPLGHDWRTVRSRARIRDGAGTAPVPRPRGVPTSRPGPGLPSLAAGLVPAHNDESGIRQTARHVNRPPLPPHLACGSSKNPTANERASALTAAAVEVGPSGVVPSSVGQRLRSAGRCGVQGSPEATAERPGLAPRGGLHSPRGPGRGGGRTATPPPDHSTHREIATRPLAPSERGPGCGAEPRMVVTLTFCAGAARPLPIDTPRVILGA